MKLKKYAIRGLIIFAVVVALCMFFSGTIRTITTAKVKILTPRQGKFSEEVELTGHVIFPAAEPVKLENAQGVSLTITSVKVQAGSEVEEGDVLFTAEIADYEKNMDTLRQSYNEAAGQLADLERKNANLRLRPTDEAWAEAYTALSAAQDAELDARVTRDALLAVEGLKPKTARCPRAPVKGLPRHGRRMRRPHRCLKRPRPPWRRLSATTSPKRRAPILSTSRSTGSR